MQAVKALLPEPHCLLMQQVRKSCALMPIYGSDGHHSFEIEPSS